MKQWEEDAKEKRRSLLKKIHVLVLLFLLAVLVLGCGYVSWALSQHPEKPSEASIPLVMLISLIREFYNRTKQWSEADMVLALDKIESTSVRADTPKDVLMFLMLERVYGTTNTRTFYKIENIKVPDIASFLISTTYKEEPA